MPGSSLLYPKKGMTLIIPQKPATSADEIPSAVSECNVADASWYRVVRLSKPEGGADIYFLPPVVCVPDVEGMSLVDAALAYADAGFFVLPTSPTDIKNPGSVVGGRWQEHSTRNVDQICTWWESNPRYGIALHVGRSGIVAFDLDSSRLDDLPPAMADGLRAAGAIFGTRTEGDRGHYLFLMPDGQKLGNSAGAFAPYGEIRGWNGVIVVAPTPHPDAATLGGHYCQRKIGVVRPLPPVLAECLSSASVEAEPKSRAELDAFLAAHVREDRPALLKGQLTKFAADTDAGKSRHDSAMAVLVWAFREAIVGCYSAQRALDELAAAFDAVKPDLSDADEFHRMARWAAAQAEQANPDETRNRIDRHLWPAPDDPLRIAERVSRLTAQDNRPLACWRNQWLRWSGECWEFIDVKELRKLLYDTLGPASYVGAKGDLLRWKPDAQKLNKVIDALGSEVLLSNRLQPPVWTDGRTDHVIACQNGLLRIADRELLPHDHRYFNTLALPFAHQRRARTPERWLKFLAEVFPGDTQSQEMLQEWFGYVLSGRTDLQKLLMMIGPTRSGKGTIDKILAALVGRNNHVGLSAADLQGGFGMQVLLDKTVASFSDERMSVRAKQFVSTLLRITGEDPITVHIKFQPDWSGQLGTRLMLMSNELPPLPDSSGAIVGRVILLHMKESFLGREDTALVKKLEEELPGILNWSLDGLDRLTKRGHFLQPDSGSKLLGLLRQTASPIMQFAEEKCSLDPKAVVPKQLLYEMWRYWCEANGYEPGNSASFGRKLVAAFGDQIDEKRMGERGAQIRHYTGIGLRDTSGPRVMVRGRW